LRSTVEVIENENVKIVSVHNIFVKSGSTYVNRRPKWSSAHCTLIVEYFSLAEVNNNSLQTFSDTLFQYASHYNDQVWGAVAWPIQVWTGVIVFLPIEMFRCVDLMLTDNITKTTIAACRRPSIHCQIIVFVFVRSQLTIQWVSTYWSRDSRKTSRKDGDLRRRLGVWDRLAAASDYDSNRFVSRW